MQLSIALQKALIHNFLPPSPPHGRFPSANSNHTHRFTSGYGYFKYQPLKRLKEKGIPEVIGAL
jgi:hypothetical protein